jgi:hypothetical protein
VGRASTALPGLGRRRFVVARNCLGASDPDGGAIASISTGSKIEPSLPEGSAVRASLRHVKIRLWDTPCRRATSLTRAPGISVSTPFATPPLASKAAAGRIRRSCWRTSLA